VSADVVVRPKNSQGAPPSNSRVGLLTLFALPLITNGEAAGRVALGLVYNLGRGIGSFRGATEQN
jgi:hypothetical protein